MADRVKENLMAPPVWHTDTTTYEDWKFDVRLWTQFTKAEKRRRGFMLYSTLPTTKDVNEKVRLAMQNGEININEEDAIDQIFEVLDKWFKKDDLSTICETWSAYKNLQKKDSETMEQFLNESEKKIKELKKEGIALPEVVLAMQLLDGAGLDKKEKQIVLTAVDYSKKEEMYDQMKQALRKFFGEQAMSRKERVTQPLIKEETVNTTETEEALYTRGRNPVRGGYYGGYSGRRGFRSSRGTGRGYYQGRQESDTNKPTSSQVGASNRGRFQRRNPRDAEGNYMKCLICESIMHFRRNCPHAQEAKRENVLETSTCSSNEEVYKVHDYSEDDKQVLMVEAANSAVLDSACSKTVTGRVWKEVYLESLSAKEKKEVRILPGGTNFKFGGESSIQSEGRMVIPCEIAGHKTTITADIVDSDIPLLLSKPDMKRLGFKLNMIDDTLEVNGKKIDLETTSSGHYYIPLRECEVKVENVYMVLEQKTREEKVKMIKKLHRQFAHPTAKSLKAIMKNADVFDEDCNTLIDDISTKCNICKRFKKTPARPVVCLPMAKQFNDVVAMDLKQYGDVYFLHFIDLFTRFSKSKVIRRKTPKIIVDCIATEWIAAGFGPPKRFLVDNGGEFDNCEYRELAEQFNVEVCATAAYSPWSNGICERNH